MTTIEERKRQLERKLKKMAEDNVVVKPTTTPNSFDPSEDAAPSSPISQDIGDSEEEEKAGNQMAEENVEQQKEENERKSVRKLGKEKYGSQSLSIEEYRSLYFQPVRFHTKTAFAIDTNMLQQLRNVVQDLGERIPIAAYIDNILREHLRQHQELLNNAAAKQRRKTTITL